MVTDNGIPTRQALSPAIVSLTVLRNQFDPFFVSSPYVATIPETTSTGSSVLQVTARDQDTVSHTFICIFQFSIPKDTYTQ